MATIIDTQPVSEYLKFYRFLPVLSEAQITKLRRVATGILELNAFTTEEILQLETAIETDSQTAGSIVGQGCYSVNQDSSFFTTRGRDH